MAATHKAELIVLGGHQISSAASIALPVERSVGSHLQANCPVLTIKA